MSISGFFKVEFSAALPGMGGIVVIDGGFVRGGDAGYLYSGTISGQGNSVTSSIRVKAMSPSAQSVFGTMGGAFDLQLSGRESGNTFSLSGPSPVPGQKGIQITGMRIAELSLK